MTARTVNADLGESVGPHSFGHDESLLPLIDLANVACGFHAGGPGAMRRAVEGCLQHGVQVGAHPGLPDIAGFGRRRMQITSQEATDLVRYQVGALSSFLDHVGGRLHHVKPHGALYAMAASDEDLMAGICEVAAQHGLAVLGMAGTAHEIVATRLGVPFVAELYVDLDYRADGSLIVGERPPGCTPDEARSRVRAAADDGTVEAVDGSRLSIEFSSICVHSDTANATGVAAAVRATLA